MTRKNSPSGSSGAPCRGTRGSAQIVGGRLDPNRSSSGGDGRRIVPGKRRDVDDRDLGEEPVTHADEVARETLLLAQRPHIPVSETREVSGLAARPSHRHPHVDVEPRGLAPEHRRGAILGAVADRK